MSTSTSYPVVTLLSQTLPRRSQSTIRRTLIALGAKVHVATIRTDHISPETTHILLTEQVACPFFVLAIASASAVQLITPAFVEDCEKYHTFTPPHSDSHTPPDDSCATAYLGASATLWIGRIWLGAYQFWRTRAQQGKGAPLHLHRVIVVGQTRPRGAARLLSPASTFVKELIVAAGAQVLEHDQSSVPTFAIVAPGLNRGNSDVIASLLDNGVICLAPAFLLDLILRVSANPVDYLLFPSQKSLCATSLTAKSIFLQDSPLTVSVNTPAQQRLPTSTQPEPTVPSRSDAALLINNEEKILCKRRSSPAKRFCLTDPLEYPSAKRERSDPIVPTDQRSIASPHLCENSVEIIDLTRSPKLTTSETKLVDSRHPSPTRHVHEKRPTLSKRVRSNGPHSLGRSKPARLSRGEVYTDVKTQVVSSSTNGENGKKPGRHVPTDSGAEAICRTNHHEHKCSMFVGNLPPTGCSTSKEEVSALEPSLIANCILKPAEATGGELTQNSACGEAVFRQLVPSATTHGRDFLSGEIPYRNGQSALHSHISSSAQVKPGKLCHNSSSSNGSHRERNSGELRGPDFGNSFESNLQAHAESDTFGVVRDLNLGNAQQYISGSDAGSLGNNSAKNSLCIPACTGNTCQQFPQHGPLFCNVKSPTRHISHTHFQKPRDGGEFAKYSLESDFDFVIASLGGAPSDKSLRRMLQSINAPEGCWFDTALEFSNIDETSRRAHIENSDAEEDRPRTPLDVPDGLCPSKGNELYSQCNREGGVSSQQKKREGNDGLHFSQLNVLDVQLPAEHVVVRNVSRPELVFLEKADDFGRAVGNEDDDHTCRCSLSFADWLIGAENIEGFVFSEAVASAHTEVGSLSRKIWLSLFESNVFGRLATPGALNDFQVGLLVGICSRLVTCNFQSEMNSRVLIELLKLREMQRVLKTDSLLASLVSTDLSSVPYRHRAVATIWSVVFQSAIWNSNECSGWPLLEKSLQPCFEDVFNGEYLTDLNRGLDLKKVNMLLESLWMVTLTLSLKTDLFAAQPLSQSNDKGAMYPEYWKIFINFFAKAQTLLCSLTSWSRQSFRPMLMTIFKFISEKYIRELWRVSEEFLTACTELVQTICKLEKVSCFCDESAFHVKHADDCSQTDRAKINDIFKTECGYLLHFGWNSINDGTGNKMKHVMKVMRIATPFTSGEGTDCESRLRKVRHHVGLVLSVADFVSNHSNGEDQVCKILTVKSERFSSLVGSKGVNYSEKELGWACIMEGVVERCRTLTTRGESGHVYLRWLLSSVTEGLNLIKRAAERRADGTRGGELLRAQETNLWTATLKRFSGLESIQQLLWHDMEALDLNLVKEYLNAVLGYISLLLTQIREWNDSTHALNAHGENEKREELVHILIGVVATVVELVSVVFSSREEQSRNISLVFGKPFTEVFCEENLNLILNLMAGTDLVHRKKYRDICKSRCTDMLCIFMDIFYWSGNDGWNEGGLKKLKEILQRGGLNFLNYGAGAYISSHSESGYDVSVIVRFWWKAITKLNWVRETVGKDNYVRSILVGVLVWMILQEGSLKEPENCNTMERMLKDVRHAIQKVEGVGDVFKEWTSYVDLNERQVYGCANAVCVQRVVVLFAADWGRVGCKAVVDHLGPAAHDMIRSKRRNRAEDGMCITGTIFNLESQARGFCVGAEVRWIQERITGICDSVEYMKHGGGWQGGKTWEAACEILLEAVFSGLGFAQCSDQNVELRVVVLRLVNAVGETNDLSGVWMATGRQLLFEQGTGADAKTGLQGAVTENVRQWRELILHGAVEDRLSCVSQGGQGRVLALRRLLAAARVGQCQKEYSLMRSVQAVVGRIQWNKRVESVVCRDALSRLLWKQICGAVGSQPLASAHETE